MRKIQLITTILLLFGFSKCYADTTMTYTPSFEQVTNVNASTTNEIKFASGTITNLSVSNVVHAGKFYGDGSNISGLTSATPTLDAVTDTGNVTTNSVQLGALVLYDSTSAVLDKESTSNEFSIDNSVSILGLGKAKHTRADTVGWGYFDTLPAELNNPTNYSIAMWLKATGTAQSQIIGWASSSAVYAPILEIDAGGGGFPGQVGFGFYDGGMKLKYTNAGAIPDITNWTHVVLRVENANTYTASGSITINGGVPVQINAGSTAWGSPVERFDSFYLGKSIINAGTVLDTNFDDVRIYDKALSNAEVSQIYNSGLGTGSDSIGAANLIIHYLMNDTAAGGTIANSAGSVCGSACNLSATAAGSAFFPDVATNPQVYDLTAPATATIISSVDGTDAGETGKLYVGDASGSTYIQGSTVSIDSAGDVEVDGFIDLEDAVWEDLRVAAVGWASQTSASPAMCNLISSALQVVCYDDGATDTAYFTVQLPHNYKLTTDIYPHAHWSPTADGDGSEFVEWELGCSWQDQDGTFPAPTYMYASSTVSTTQWDSLHTEFKCSIEHGAMGTRCTEGTNYLEGSDIGSLSSMLVCRISRATAVDDYNNDAALLEIDFHYQVDSLGSRNETTK